MSRALLKWTVPAVALAVVVLVVLAVRTPAPRAVASEPADGAVVDAAPRDVAVTLVGADDPVAAHLTVTREGGGRPVTTGPARLRGDRLVVPVSIVDAGRYVAAYHVELADGRQVAGQTGFSVAAPGQSTAAGRTAPDAAPDTDAGAGAASHDHAAGDPVTGLFLAVDVLLTGVLIAYLVRRPRLRREPIAIGPPAAGGSPTGPTKGDR